METYNAIYLRVRKSLKNAGIEAADTEAKYIVAHGMGKTKEEMLAMYKIYATDDSIRRKIEQSLERRLNGEPLAYIIGEWEFYGLNIIVNENVLIPRTDTELLAEEAIKLIKRKVWKTRVLDLCAGSGCVGLAIARNIPGCHVVMADKSEDILALCRQNALQNNLSRNTAAIEVNALEAPPALIGAFDVIVCNPPYIPSKVIETLDNSVKDYEPTAALDGGADGLDFFRAVAEKWSKVIKPGGNLAFECGIEQTAEVQYMMKQNGFVNVKAHKDTQGIERVITGMKSE